MLIGLLWAAGYLYPTSMRMREDGRLAVSFRTEARFRGQFVASHPGKHMTCLPLFMPGAGNQFLCSYFFLSFFHFCFCFFPKDLRSEIQMFDHLEKEQI